MIYTYRGKIYPDYLKQWNAHQFIAPVAKKFCNGKGMDVGPGQWPLEGSIPWDVDKGHHAEALPEGPFDYIFSSHCLEHVTNPVAVLEHWKSRLKESGVLFLYLPHPDMEYWLPQNNKKHLHAWTPLQMKKLVEDVGFVDVLYSERDMGWSFSVVGFNVR